MLAVEGIAPIRRNNREQRRLAHGLFHAHRAPKEHEDGHAPYATVLDGFVVFL